MFLYGITFLFVGLTTANRLFFPNVPSGNEIKIHVDKNTYYSITLTAYHRALMEFWGYTNIHDFTVNATSGYQDPNDSSLKDCTWNNGPEISYKYCESYRRFWMSDLRLFQENDGIRIFEIIGTTRDSFEVFQVEKWSAEILIYYEKFVNGKGQGSKSMYYPPGSNVPIDNLYLEFKNTIISEYDTGSLYFLRNDEYLVGTNDLEYFEYDKTQDSPRAKGEKVAMNKYLFQHEFNSENQNMHFVFPDYDFFFADLQKNNYYKDRAYVYEHNILRKRSINDEISYEISSKNDETLTYNENTLQNFVINNITGYYDSVDGLSLSYDCKTSNTHATYHLVGPSVSITIECSPVLENQSQIANFTYQNNFINEEACISTPTKQKCVHLDFRFGHKSHYNFDVVEIPRAFKPGEKSHFEFNFNFFEKVFESVKEAIGTWWAFAKIMCIIVAIVGIPCMVIAALIVLRSYCPCK